MGCVMQVHGTLHASTWRALKIWNVMWTHEICHVSTWNFWHATAWSHPCIHMTWTSMSLNRCPDCILSWNWTGGVLNSTSACKLPNKSSFFFLNPSMTLSKVEGISCSIIWWRLTCVNPMTVSGKSLLTMRMLRISVIPLCQTSCPLRTVHLYWSSEKVN